MPKHPKYIYISEASMVEFARRIDVATASGAAFHGEVSIDESSGNAYLSVEQDAVDGRVAAATTTTVEPLNAAWLCPGPLCPVG